MASFNRDNKRPGSGFNRGFGGRSGGPKQMYPATCSKCGQSCEVPFKPTGERPVYCNNCFKNQGGAPKFVPKVFGGGGAAAGGSAPGGAVSKAQFDSLNAKVDKILALLTAVKAEPAPVSSAAKVKAKKPAVKKAKAAVKKSKSKK